jgi:hypothetical protein
MRLAWLLAALALSGCEMPVDPKVAEAEKRGADYAWEHDFKMTSDCGSLQDLDERQGCAKWVNARDDQ